MFGFVTQTRFDNTIKYYEDRLSALERAVGKRDGKIAELEQAAFLIDGDFSEFTGEFIERNRHSVVEVLKQIADHVGCDLKFVPRKIEKARVDLVCKEEK